jgi:hypothetical protein
LAKGLELGDGEGDGFGKFMERLKEEFIIQFGRCLCGDGWGFLGREVRIGPGSVYDVFGYSTRFQRISTLGRVVERVMGEGAKAEICFPYAWEKAEVFCLRCSQDWGYMESKGFVVGKMGDDSSLAEVRRWIARGEVEEQDSREEMGERRARLEWRDVIFG